MCMQELLSFVIELQHLDSSLPFPFTPSPKLYYEKLFASKLYSHHQNKHSVKAS